MKKNIVGKRKSYNYGPDHPNWKGGKTRHKEGYILINVTQDKMFEGKYNILEHRYIMAKFLGRILKKDEHVHHKNGNKTDNRLDNLELITAHDHWVEHHGYRKGNHFTLKERFCPKCNIGFFPVSCHNGSKQKYCSKSCFMKDLWNEMHKSKSFNKLGRNKKFP